MHLPAARIVRDRADSTPVRLRSDHDFHTAVCPSAVGHDPGPAPTDAHDPGWGSVRGNGALAVEPATVPEPPRRVEHRYVRGRLAYPTGNVASRVSATHVKEDDMYARVATFESDPAKIDDAIAMVRSEVDGETPLGLEGAKMLMLVDRTSGKGVGITLFESEEAMRRGDQTLDDMNPGSTESRVSVEFFEVPVQTVT